MSGELQVTTTALRQLSERQRQIVDRIAAAGQIVDGTAVAVGITHGPVCAPTITAISAAGLSRDAAVAAMQAVSTSLAEKLDAAAANYERTDTTQASHLDGEMQGR
ncbi:ESX-1 secretion-associated protein [Mycolicibacterium goodii]|uniref:ESX-1 secretion-associated protein n=1 Tax=Mycolicibacterium goodii TaxID=134601 RepID=UPI001BDC0E42|nr:ESX-1 secretion-associated protein [Mycolicibacterium goodii]MBU8817745.1 ESX-1 secretion-associated protein [Mycolicibacterium goodii]MBU8834541.1 ESX-1 secretion-associated protein [Mycolicibacterium goodii]ULN47903.1 ESX-1 secretion-associated protein [Mycolicibacterium goodii]